MELKTEDNTVENDTEINDKAQDVLLEDDEPFVTSAPKLSKEEFYKHPSMSMIRKGISSVGIVCYISAVFTVMVSIMQTIFDKSLNVTAMVVGSLITAVLLIGLGLGIHLMRSKVCMYILLGFALLNCITTMILEGMPGGVLILAIAIMGTINFSNFEKAWAEYQATGHITDTYNINNNPLMKDIQLFGKKRR